MAGIRKPSSQCTIRSVFTSQQCQRISRSDSPLFLTRQPSRQYSAPIDGRIPESKQKYVPTSGTYPKGFRVSGTYVGVKASNTTFPDLALITSEKPCSAAAVFTKNKFRAAPVTISKAMLQRKQNKNIHSIIVNSGCANAVTGKGGLEDAESMVTALDGLETDSTTDSSLVMSTGELGRSLVMRLRYVLISIPLSTKLSF